MKPTKSLVTISLCVGMAFSAFAGTAHNACNQIRQQCAHNQMSQATCAKRMAHCTSHAAIKREHQIKTGQAQQNNPSTAQQTAQQPTIQQASAATTQQSH